MTEKNGWLCLTRRSGEGILIGKDVELMVSDFSNDAHGNKIVKIAVRAPKEIPILRLELLIRDQIQQSFNE